MTSASQVPPRKSDQNTEKNRGHYTCIGLRYKVLNEKDAGYQRVHDEPRRFDKLVQSGAGQCRNWTGMTGEFGFLLHAIPKINAFGITRFVAANDPVSGSVAIVMPGQMEKCNRLAWFTTG